MAASVALASSQASAFEPACGTVIVPSNLGLGVPAPANTLHPILSTNSLAEVQIFRLLYRPVVWANERAEVDGEKSLASSITAADGGATFHVTLKPYAWSDGVPVSADDVHYSWEMIEKLGRAYVAFGSGGFPQLVRDVTVTGPLTLDVHLVRGVNVDWFETVGLSQLYALPRHVWGGFSIAQQQSLQSTASFYRVVDGPFRLERLVVGRYASLTPNQTYGGHHPSIRRLVVDFLEGTDPLADLAAGQIDMVTMPFTVWDAARALRGFETITIGPAASFTTIVPNIASTTAPFLADVRVREAIATAIDQQRLVRAVFHGAALPEQDFVPSSLTQFLSPEIRNQPSPLLYDPAKASGLLAAAGWQPGPDGIRVRDGRRLTLEVMTTAGAASGLTMLQLIRGDLARVGIELRIHEIEFNQLLARMSGPASGWEAAYLAWTLPGYPDGTQMFSSTSTGNYEHFHNADIDRLLDAAIYSNGTDGLFALENAVRQQQPMIFLPDGYSIVLARPGIGGVRQFLTSNGAWSPEYLTLSGSLACH